MRCVLCVCGDMLFECVCNALFLLVCFACVWPVCVKLMFPRLRFNAVVASASVCVICVVCAIVLYLFYLLLCCVRLCCVVSAISYCTFMIWC